MTAKEPMLWMPGWAIRIHVTIKLSDGADALQKAILGLMKAGTPGLPGSLANELCLGENIVESAMKSLSEQGWIQWGDGEWERPIKPSDGADKLQNDILRLMRDGVPGRLDILAKKLVLEESIVEAAIKSLNEQGCLLLINGVWELAFANHEAEVQRRTGWVFWDSLRQRLLPELLLDELDCSLDMIETATQATESLEADKFPRPDPSQVRMELVPTVEARGFRARELRKTTKPFEFYDLDLGDSIQRVTLHDSRRKMRWHPLAVPYRIEENLGSQPSIYCCEPTYSPDLSFEAPYSPFLRAVMEEKNTKAYAPIKAHANDLQSNHRAKHSAAFLAGFGSPERLDAEAKDAVRRMTGETRIQGPFATPVLFGAAEDAERIWIATAKLPQSSKNLRTQYSSVLQALATCISDELLPRWKGNRSAKELATRFPSRHDAGKRRVSFEDCRRRWDGVVSQFSRDQGIPFDSWGISTAGEMRSAATFEPRRTQLGIVLRSWGAFAICASNDPEGRFVLYWIRESLKQFPDLFEVFEAVKDQRNIDKGRNSESISINKYRDSIYEIWKAIANGHKRATEQLGSPKP